MRTTWQWEIEGPAGFFQGAVQAVDPRDAVSRALTTETTPGVLLGESLNISIEVLYLAPGNASKRFEVFMDGYRLLVYKA